MQSIKTLIAGIVAAAVMLTAVWAQAQGHIRLTSVAEQEKEVFNEEGKKELRLVPVGKVVPGDEVIFTTYYENISKEAAANAVITNPIPEHMIYTAESAAGADTRITFSADGGATYDLPGKLLILDATGRQLPARPQYYTHIRWTIEKPLSSGQRGAVSFRALLK